MGERYVRPPLVAGEQQPRRAAVARLGSWAAVVLTVAVLAVLAALLAAHLGGGEDPGITRSPTPTATR